MQLVVGLVQPLRALEGARLVLVEDLLAAVADGLITPGGEGGLRGEVLALLQRLLVTRVDLERELVELERPGVVTERVHHRPGALEPLGIARRDLGDELVDRAGGLEVLPLLQRHAQGEIGIDVERVGGEVLLERLDAGVVAPRLEHRLGHRQRRGSGDRTEEAAPLLLLLTQLQHAAQPGPGFALVGIELEELLVQLDGEVVVSPLGRFLGLLDVLGEVHGGIRPNTPPPGGAWRRRTG